MENTLSVSEISELVCTRISHDLIGNIGAVSNAVELLEEGDMDFMDDIRSILKVSSGVLTARLKFFAWPSALTMPIWKNWILSKKRRLIILKLLAMSIIPSV